MKWNDKVERLGSIQAGSLDTMIANRMWKGLGLGCSFKPLALAHLEHQLFGRIDKEIPDVVRLTNILKHCFTSYVNCEFPWDDPQVITYKAQDDLLSYIPDNLEVGAGSWPLFIGRVDKTTTLTVHACIPKFGSQDTGDFIWQKLVPPYYVCACTDNYRFAVQDVTVFVAQFLTESDLIEVYNAS